MFLDFFPAVNLTRVKKGWTERNTWFSEFQKISPFSDQNQSPTQVGKIHTVYLQFV
jgi:hypothetical protein